MVNQLSYDTYIVVWFDLIVLSATFNNISAILVEETGVPGENHQLVASH